MTGLGRLLLIALAAYGLSGCASQMVQPIALDGPATNIEYACPASGTLTRRVGSSSTLTYEGAEPGDPVVCRVTDEKGVAHRLLYGWFSLPTTQEFEKRAVLNAVFSGAQQDLCFVGVNRPMKTTGYSPDVNQSFVYENCWKQLGQKLVEVKGRFVKAVVLQTTEEGRAGNTFAADRTIYFDTETKVFFRMDVNMRRGTPVYGYNVDVLKRTQDLASHF